MAVRLNPKTIGIFSRPSNVAIGYLKRRSLRRQGFGCDGLRQINDPLAAGAAAADICFDRGICGNAAARDLLADGDCAGIDSADRQNPVGF